MNLNDAYQTEIDLLPIVTDMERRGVRLDGKVNPLAAQWTQQQESDDAYLEKMTGQKPGSDAMWMTLIAQRRIDESRLTYTEKGSPQFGREHLDRLIEDEQLRDVLKRRSILNKVVGTYLRPWAESWRKYRRLYPFYNQTRGENDYGTRTGRFSSNLQQIPQPVDGLPNLRALILAEEGHIVLKRDYQAQEIRVAAHYSEGHIMEAFQNNPDMDVHQFVHDIIESETGVDLPRRAVKAVSFLKLYGGGANALSVRLECDVKSARQLMKLYDRFIPEFGQLSRDLQRQFYIRTWGGRTYEPERGFEYKQINVLVQGSSADMMKHAMIRYYNDPGRKGDILMTVHDELVVTCPDGYQNEEMERMRWAMEDMDGWDVPIKTDGSIGENYGELEAC